MKLTEKDKSFLENLKNLMESKDLWVELKLGRPSYMVLKGTYGEKIHKTFRMTGREMAVLPAIQPGVCRGVPDDSDDRKDLWDAAEGICD